MENRGYSGFYLYLITDVPFLAGTPDVFGCINPSSSNLIGNEDDFLFRFDIVPFDYDLPNPNYYYNIKNIGTNNYLHQYFLYYNNNLDLVNHNQMVQYQIEI